MPDYWLRFTDNDGAFRRSYKFSASGDQAALALAEQADRTTNREVWDGDRLVGKFPARGR